MSVHQEQPSHTAAPAPASASDRAARGASAGTFSSSRWSAVALLGVVAAALLALPVAVWLDLNDISARALRSEANELSNVISGIRDYYAHDVVGRVRSIETATQVVPNYREVPGAIPIPATLSLELGQAIGARQGNVGYRFFSDYPFRNRSPHVMDAVETQAFVDLRRDPQTPIYSFSGSLLNRRVRLMAPVLMQPECVACHNTHPDSTKRDWVTGDVRGIQEIIIDQPIVAKNVIVVAVKHILTDIVEDSLGTTGVNIELNSFGDLRVFRDGKVWEGTWRASPDGPPKWLGAGEVPIDLKPGQSWVQVVQEITDITYQ